MSRLESLQSSDFDIHDLRSDESCQALTALLRLVSSCAGPHGKNQVIRNTCGGHMTITSSSVRMLSAMMISRSELKIIVSAILGHVKHYNDSGLFLAYVILRAIKLLSVLDCHHFTTSALLHTFVSTVNSYLSSDSCDVVVKVDFSNVRVLLAYVKSILTSKTLLNLNSSDCRNLSRLVVETFVRAVPTVPGKRHSNGWFLIGVENLPVSASKTLQGVLLACPEISVCEKTNSLPLKTITETINSDTEAMSRVKVVVVTCSMSGDVEELIDVNFEATELEFSQIDEAVVHKMVALCTCFERGNVGLVLCQRVIHPRIKTVLKSYGVLYVDRLGSQVIPYLRDLTGCIPVSSVMLGENELRDCYGCLTSASHHVEGGRGFLLLNNEDVSIVSLLVCGEFEERVAELKNCVNSCLQGLSLLAKEAKFLMGGGCWQMNCAAMLEKQFLSDVSKTLEEMSCSEVELRQVLSGFVSLLRGWCLQLKGDQEHLLFDVQTGHAWRTPKGMADSIGREEVIQCCCGFKSAPNCYLQGLDIVLDCDSPSALLMDMNELDQSVKDSWDYDDVVLDSFTASVQALNKAVLTTGLLLSVGQFVTDKN